MTTEWMYTNGEVLKAKVTTDEGSSEGKTSEAIYKEVRSTRTSNTVHLYTKVVTPTTES